VQERMRRRRREFGGRGALCEEAGAIGVVEPERRVAATTDVGNLLAASAPFVDLTGGARRTIVELCPITLTMGSTYCSRASAMSNSISTRCRWIT
jgi:hypothetical protein